MQTIQPCPQWELIIIIIPVTMSIVLSSWPQGHCESYSVHLMNVEQRQAAANPQTKPHDLGCEFTCRQLSSTTTIAIYYYYSARKLILIYRPTEGRRLSWPKLICTCRVYVGGNSVEIKTEADGNVITECPSTAGMFWFPADNYSALLCLSLTISFFVSFYV